MEFYGYICANCGDDFGDWIPDEGCGVCGCHTAEKRRRPKSRSLRDDLLDLIEWVDANPALETVTPKIREILKNPIHSRALGMVKGN